MRTYYATLTFTLKINPSIAFKIAQKQKQKQRSRKKTTQRTFNIARSRSLEGRTTQKIVSDAKCRRATTTIYPHTANFNRATTVNGGYPSSNCNNCSKCHSKHSIFNVHSWRCVFYFNNSQQPTTNDQKQSPRRSFVQVLRFHRSTYY